MRFKKGDRCKIVSRTNTHEFDIGEEVTVSDEMISLVGNVYCVSNVVGWFVSPEDLELVTPKKTKNQER